ncbi:MAG: hypothetical protein ISN26_00085 [Betaproteobacteria bacterium AqS2]|uniref:Uncharacterized protein n=1 Tax=Candidatus Amphirhobacter heronislandensis TaxID=1732024 RepID=A0A930UGL6_9GAMM|nr:hypothetical protein [Betaproteobacteria bacterium AqS2]
MAATYKVEFILEDWMLKGLESGKYDIVGGNLLKKEGRQVVKWLNAANITPPEEVNSVLGNAVQFAQGAASPAFVTSVVNLALGVAIFRKLERIEDRIDEAIHLLRKVSHRVDDIYDETVRGNGHGLIVGGLALFQEARISSDYEDILRDARKDLVRGISNVEYWLQSTPSEKLLDRLNLVEELSTSLVMASIVKAQILRILEKSPIDSVPIPIKEALETIDHLEQRLGIRRRKDTVPTTAQLKGRKLVKSNKALKIAANESLNLQLAFIQGNYILTNPI